MNLQPLDLTILAIFIGLITFIAIGTRKYTNSVADFLAASRCGGRYLICVSEGMVALAAISTVASFEMYFEGGFCLQWWGFLGTPMLVLMGISGWIIYRFRETRALTLGQLFEIRYSKNFRIFMGILGWACGIVNFGIFPAVGGRFFIHYCGLPEHFTIFGFQVLTLAVLMFFLISVSLFFTFIGGQIAVIVTDFVQGAICNIGLVALIAFLLIKFDWTLLSRVVTNTPEGMSLVNPFETTKIPDFNIWFCMIGIASMFYGTLSWQGNQGFNCSAKSAHELRMARVLGNFRIAILTLMYMLFPICAYVVLHSSEFSSLSHGINAALDAISSNPKDTIRVQMTVPVVLSKLFPVGLLGLFAAIMLAGFIANHNTYLHSWGSIFVQDVILPFRKKPFTPSQHLLLIRLSICFVAVFIFIFSLLFRQTQQILMFFAITGAIYGGGVGAVIIGGLYWKRGTTAAAWTTMIYGAAVSVTAIIIQQVWLTLYNERFPINSQYILFFVMCTCLILYISVSLLGKRTEFNLDKMLHRGKYSHVGDPALDAQPVVGLKAFFGNYKLSFKDKMEYGAVIFWFFGWLIVFLAGTVYYYIFGISDSGWTKIWQIFTYSSYAMIVAVTIWFTIGGTKDFIDLFKNLKSAKRNDADDGRVLDHQSTADVISTHAELKNGVEANEHGKPSQVNV